QALGQGGTTHRAHDFGNIRKPRKTEHRPPDPAPHPPRGMLITGLLTGLVLGMFFSFLVYLSGVLPPVGVVAEVPADSPEQVAAAQQRRTEELEQAAARLQLEFYKELPNYEVIVDTPNNTRPASTTSATAQAVRQAQANNVATAVTPDTAAEPAATAPTPAPTTPETVPVPAAAAAPVPAPTPAPAVAASGPSYMLQAGAFQQESSAIAQSERLTALGLQARVKKEALLGKTLFLVQSGPYLSRDELTQIERLLRSNSIDTMRIGISQ